MLTAPARPLPYTRARGGGLAVVLAAGWRRRDPGAVRAWLELGFRSKSGQLGRFHARIVVRNHAGMVKSKVFWFGLRPRDRSFGVRVGSREGVEKVLAASVGAANSRQFRHASWFSGAIIRFAWQHPPDFPLWPFSVSHYNQATLSLLSSTFH